MFKIAPSILSADFSRLGDEVQAVADAGADLIHIDVMDGHFVPNLTIGPLVVEAVRRVTQLPLDVHLMISNPDNLIDDFASAGADWLSVHVEILPHLHRTIQVMRAKGLKTSVALNPSTPLSSIEWVLADLDQVVIMSVNPGYGGQSFIRESLNKIRRLKEMIHQGNLSTLIQVDGGIKEDNIAEAAAAGADVFVAGSAIFKTPDYKATIARLRATMSG